MGQFGEHGERNAEALRDRAAALQDGKSIIAVGAHDVLSRASIRNALSARSCSMPITSVRMVSRSAAYFTASWSAISPTLRNPSHNCSTSTAISSGASTRSGARITQTCRVSSNFILACRGNFGRLASLTLMLRLDAIDLSVLRLQYSICPGHERARRYVAVHIGMIQRIQLNP